ncbi:MAG: pyridoxal phosphate-dependent decarboxylase family protein [Aureliella sp.]
MTDIPRDSSSSLDPECWQPVREQAHRMLDSILDHVEHCRDEAVWQPLPDQVRQTFRSPLPVEPTPLADVYATFDQFVRPYCAGNIHPGFMGWVQGGGSVAGLLAEMLAGGLNANLGGRDQSPLEVEKEVVQWMRQLFQFPETASGLFVTGSSIANFIAILVARNAALGGAPRKAGMLATGVQLTAYTSQAAHRCISQALDMAGIGSDSLRKIPVDDQQRIDLTALESAIDSDLERGNQPFCIIGCAGTVDVGAIDHLVRLRETADRHRLHFHIDGAFGALGLLSPNIAPKLRGIELADSIAFDFHKWTQVPYDAGFILVRDRAKHMASFENPADYLSRDPRAMSAASPWPCDLGPDLSRGFRALKTWMTFKVYGARRLGLVMDENCRLANYLADRIRASSELELLAPVPLNIVCFRYRCEDADRVNQAIVAAVQHSGLVAPSSTRINGAFAIRAAIFNHRTSTRDIDLLLDQVLIQAHKLSAGPKAASAQSTEGS